MQYYFRFLNNVPLSYFYKYFNDTVIYTVSPQIIYEEVEELLNSIITFCAINPDEQKHFFCHPSFLIHFFKLFFAEVRCVSRLVNFLRLEIPFKRNFSRKEE